jgi:hypothetical protein
MKRSAFNTTFGAVLLAIFAGVWLWQSPGLLRGKLTQQEIAGYLANIAVAWALPCFRRARSPHAGCPTS